MKRGGPLARRVPLRASSSLLRRCPLNPVSPRRRREKPEYERRRDAYMAGHRACEWPTGCEAASTDLHHKRGRVGADYLDVDHFAALCAHHHRVATENPREAIRLGISEPRIGRGGR